MPKIYTLKSITGSEIELEVVEKSRNAIVLKNRSTGQLYKVVIERAENGRIVLNINGEKHVVYSDSFGVTVDYATPLVYDIEYKVEEQKETTRTTQQQVVIDQYTIVSPITGRVTEIRVKPGDRVRSGDTVVVIESMKMMIEVKSHLEGTIEEIYVAQGRPVNKGERLVRVKPL